MEAKLLLQLSTHNGGPDWHTTRVEQEVMGQTSHELLQVLESLVPGLLIAHGFHRNCVFEEEEHEQL